MKPAKIILAVIVGIIVIGDIGLVIWGGANATLSVLLWTASKQYPVIPFVIGFLCGHIFFPVVVE